MSAIFGLVFFDSRPFPHEALDAIGRDMSRWGPDGFNVWHGGQAGLGFVSLIVTPESRYEQMPIRDEKRHISLVAAARLDNRDELCDFFSIPSSDRLTTPDGELVMRAFQKWGEDCPRHLLGDWSFAAWDSREQKLILARDHLGNTGLYYSFKPPLFAFASDPQALFASGGIQREINEMKLARHLTFFSIEDDSETIWKSVHNLLPAHLLAATQDGLKVHRYWSIENSHAEVPRSDEECLEGFLFRYRAAVRSRLRSTRPIGIFLSSGLDSGSVAALSAEALSEGGGKLAAFTSVPMHPAEHLFPGSRTDEWPLAHQIALKYPNIEHIPIRAETVSPLDGIKRALSILCSPMHAAVNAYWILAILDEARSRGIGVLLNGQLGNGGVSWSGGRDRIFTIFASGEWKAGFKALTAWKSHHGYSWFRTVKRHILRPLINPIWSQRRRIFHPFDPPWTGMAAINPAFAGRLGLRREMRAHGYDISFSKPITPMKERELTLFRNAQAGGAIWHTFGSAFGLEARDPTADVSLIEFCMGIPEEQYVTQGGERMLLRRAMEKLIPPDVQWNTRRGKQAADVALRLLNQAGEINAVLDKLGNSLTVASYLDMNEMRKAWDEVRADKTPRTSLLVERLLIRGIMTGLFLESLERMGS